MAVKRLFGVTEIASTQFRSLSDAERYLRKIQEEVKDASSLLRAYEAQFAKIARQPILAADISFKINTDPNKKGGGKIVTDKIDKVIIPKLDALKKNFEVVDALSEKVQELEAMEANIAVSFKGVRGQQELIKSIRAMKAGIEAQMKKAKEHLETVGQKHAPAPFKDFLKAVSAKLTQDLDFSKSKLSVYAWQTPADEQAFTVYIELTNLVEDTGDVYPKFFIVFTCVLAPISGDKTQLSLEYYVTVMHDFQSPGKFHEGRRVFNPKEAMTEIGHLLSMENISHAIGTLPHNLHTVDPKVLKVKAGAGPKVLKVEVDPSSLIFWFIKSVKEKEAKDLMISMAVDVKAMMSHIRGAQIKMRMIEGDEGHLGAKFSLINPAKDGQIDVQAVDWMRDTFKLRDDQVREIVKVINKTSR